MGRGLVNRLTITLTPTDVLTDQSARYMFSAMSLASGEMATYVSAEGSALTHAQRPIEVRVPISRPQNPPALVARFQNMPSSTTPSSGEMKKLKSACT